MTTAHIKMPNIAPLVRYVADGIQTILQYPFPIFTENDLAVYFDGARQYSGFIVSGAGQTEGGTVTFDTAPDADVVVMLERNMPLERLTDFLEGGDFSAQALNNELDYLIAAIQEVSRAQTAMLRYTDNEAPADITLPIKTMRANKVLGFDGNGDPIPVSTAGTMAAPDFTAAGTGAITRTSHDKFSDFIAITDFGAIGDGVTDDTIAIQQALSAHDQVYVPQGTYLITATITVTKSQSLFGMGQSSIIKAQSNSFNALELPEGDARLANIRIENGATGIKLFGRDSACIQNTINDVSISGANIGILLDGYDDTNKPCMSNRFNRIYIEKMATHGVHLTKTSTGDSPSSNHFQGVRIFSNGTATTGSGFYIEHGENANSFIDCEADVNGPTADSCIRIGAQSDKTLLLNIYTVSTNNVPNIKLDAGSLETSIINLHAQSDGAAILDNTSGNYDAYNAGATDKNRLRKTTITDLKATLMRFDTEYIDSAGTHILDLSHSVHIVDATSSAITIKLPTATNAAGVTMTVKKKDNTSNIVTITEDSGSGPDGGDLQLGGEGDYITAVSNCATWFVIASNRMAGNTRYIDSSGTIDIDMAVDTYLLSSFGGAMTARLPPANASEAIGRTVTLKKTDNSANAITISEQGGNGPDQSNQTLSSQYDAMTIVSDGGQWFVISAHTQNTYTHKNEALRNIHQKGFII